MQIGCREISKVNDAKKNNELAKLFAETQNDCELKGFFGFSEEEVAPGPDPMLAYIAAQIVSEYMEEHGYTALTDEESGKMLWEFTFS